MVPYQNRQSLSLTRKNPLSQNLRRRLKKRNSGIPLTVITKETVQENDRDNENQKKILLQILEKKRKITKMTAFSNKLQVSEPSPKYHSRLNWNLNAQLTEYRAEEHHEERVGNK